MLLTEGKWNVFSCPRILQAIDLSVDHKPELEHEKQRIQSAGGFIHAGRVNGSLNLTRAIGMHFEPRYQDLFVAPLSFSLALGALVLEKYTVCQSLRSCSLNLCACRGHGI